MDAVTLVTVVAESTFTLIISPAEIDVVQVVKAKSWFLSVDDKVGFSVPVIVSATVGGKLAYVSFQKSITIEPDWSATRVQLLMVAANGNSKSPFKPVVIVEPPPSITTASVPTA